MGTEMMGKGGREGWGPRSERPTRRIPVSSRRPATPPLPENGHYHGTDEGADDPAGTQSEPVAIEEAPQQSPNEGTGDPGPEGHGPIDAALGSTEDVLRRGTHEHAGEDYPENEHGARLER